MPDSKPTGPIEDFLHTLSGALAHDPALAPRVLAEARDHLEEAARAEEANGASRTEAERLAVLRFGDARAVAQAVARRSALAGFASALLRVGAVGCWTVAAWLMSVLLFVLPGRNDAQIPFWSVVMVGFVAYGAVAWWHAAHPRAGLVRRFLVVAGPASIALGAWAVGTMALRAARGQDFEGYVVLMGAGLAAHGGAVLLHLWTTQDGGGPLSVAS